MMRSPMDKMVRRGMTKEQMIRVAAEKEKEPPRRRRDEPCRASLMKKSERGTW